VIQKYGSVADWRNAVGTGPYMIEDYVPGSIIEYKRNPDYWEKDPVGPGKGNQLPYPDAMRTLIIPDLSTTYAALRTGKIDWQPTVTLTDAQTLWQTSPDLEYTKFVAGMMAIGLAQEKPENPFHDVRVRQAMTLAIDYETIKRDYYGGEAEIIGWPSDPGLIFYEGLDELPAAVQELYSYNPDKAKELLAEAGYPNGFKSTCIVQSLSERIDELSILKEMWQQVGIDVEINALEGGAYTAHAGAGVPYDQMLYRTFPGSYFNMHLYQAFTRGAAILNISHINSPPGTDQYLEDLFNDQSENLFVDMNKVYDDVKKVNRYVMEQAYAVPFPLPYTYSFWWPWLKNNYGQGEELLRYSWIDRNMKTSMGY